MHYERYETFSVYCIITNTNVNDIHRSIYTCNIFAYVCMYMPVNSNERQCVHVVECLITINCICAIG